MAVAEDGGAEQQRVNPVAKEQQQEQEEDEASAAATATAVVDTQ
eukprot:COSAG05_NODE_674_length_7989_cov_2.918504_2_plen_44_part_00